MNECSGAGGRRRNAGPGCRLYCGCHISVNLPHIVVLTLLIGSVSVPQLTCLQLNKSQPLARRFLGCRICVGPAGLEVGGADGCIFGSASSGAATKRKQSFASCDSLAYDAEIKTPNRPASAASPQAMSWKNRLLSFSIFFRSELRSVLYCSTCKISRLLSCCVQRSYAILKLEGTVPRYCLSL